ncbi:uncharacterized protein LOC106649045 [Trichogramma pretiosum]|uniref:uncharacterized protein LOC106649045 n=1 Tax=Trichogramma pretiosum TaxID=7493 RepID=UPI0006C9D2C0|nr:uncharacterized protein LOC106649045 [Trichogramma pretiosum]
MCTPILSKDGCCPAPSKPKNEDPSAGKYYHEVGAEMVGNQLIIRMEKDKNKKAKLKKASWEPPCDCDVIEIKRPSGNKGPRITNAGDNNQILFRVHSRGHLNKKDDPHYRPQAVAYKINRSGDYGDDRCRKVTVYPQLGGPISQEVYTDHITECNENVYMLRVKKRNDDKDARAKKQNLEVELHTPQADPSPGPGNRGKPVKILQSPCTRQDHLDKKKTTLACDKDKGKNKGKKDKK